MSLSLAETANLLLALTCLLAAAHVTGFLFVRLRQPRVIGEIVGGFLLGRTVLGTLAPGTFAALFPARGPTPAALGAVYQLGLLLLMFGSGAEIRAGFAAGERRSAIAIAASGMLLPVVAALVFLSVWGPTHMGPAQHRTAFGMVFAIGMAVTSIPVIARIMLDLRLLDTSFARVVLGAAVLEDVLLYAMLSVALGLAGSGSRAELGLPGWLGIEANSASGAAYHVMASFGFFGFGHFAGQGLYQRAVGQRGNWLYRASPVGWLLIYLMSVTTAAVVLGIAPMLGAFVAGIVAARVPSALSAGREAIQQFSAAFFIPLYFAIVGFRLDLRQELDLGFFAVFLLFACVVKVSGVYLGARAVRETPRAALNLGMAMNARGGPAIVLASVSLDAGIIDGAFYVHLILLAVITSSLAGAWLQRALQSGRPLR